MRLATDNITDNSDIGGISKPLMNEKNLDLKISPVKKMSAI